jgi:hypothetical protein
MSRRIVAEALVVVVQLRAEEVRAGLSRHPAAPDDPQPISAPPADGALDATTAGPLPGAGPQ